LGERTFTAEDAERAEKIENKESFLPTVFFLRVLRALCGERFLPEFDMHSIRTGGRFLPHHVVYFGAVQTLLAG
jgi:hypothetical protein